MQGLQGTALDGRGARRGLIALATALALGAASAAGAQAATLSGTVTSQSDGDPFVALSGATVDVKDTTTGVVVASTSSDPAGDYAVAVANGTYDVEVSAGGYESLQRDDVDLTADADLDETLVATGYGRIHGIVRDSGGRPVPGVAVLSTTVTTTGARDGTFSLAAPQGAAALRISGGATGANWTFFADGGMTLGTEQEIDLTVPPLHLLTARVLGVADVPVPDADVRIPQLRVAVGAGVPGTIRNEQRRGVTDSAGEVAGLVIEGGRASGFGSSIAVTPTIASGYEAKAVAVPAISGPTTVVIRPGRIGRLSLTLLGGASQDVHGAASIRAGSWWFNPNGDPFGIVGPETLTTLTIVHSSYESPSPWEFVSDPFLLTGLMSETLQFPAYETSTVEVLDDNGDPVEDAVVTAPEMTVAAGPLALPGTLRWQNHVGETDSSGEVDFDTFDGASSDVAVPGEVVPPPGSGLAPEQFTIATPGSGTTTVELDPLVP